MASIQKKVNKDGSISYLVQIRRKGFKAYNKRTRTKAAALKHGREVELAMENGTWDEFAQEEQKKGHATLKHFIPLYLRDVAPNKAGGKKTLDYETSVLNQVLKHKIANMDIYKIKKGHIIYLRDVWFKEDNQANTIIRKLTVLQTLFNEIRDRWHHSSLQNPVIGAKPPMAAGTDVREVNLSPEQINDLKEAYRACKSPYMAWTFELALETGARRRELLENIWGNIDLEGRTMFIPTELDKNRIPRKIPLTPRAMEILTEMAEVLDKKALYLTPRQSLSRCSEKDRAFAKNQRQSKKLIPIEANAFRLSSGRAIKRSGVEGFWFRDTRHIALTMLANIYPKCQSLAKISGHQKLDTLLRYYDETNEERLAQMDVYFANNAKPPELYN